MFSVRVYSGYMKVSRKSETKVGGDSCSIGEIIPFQELGDV